MTSEEGKATSTKTWYVPHHAVLIPNKPVKVRIDFDAAAKFDSVSLKDKLLTGSDLLNSLVGNLMRFRRGRIGVMANIEQMFHQVYVWRKRLIATLVVRLRRHTETKRVSDDGSRIWLCRLAMQCELRDEENFSWLTRGSYWRHDSCRKLELLCEWPADIKAKLRRSYSSNEGADSNLSYWWMASHERMSNSRQVHPAIPLRKWHVTLFILTVTSYRRRELWVLIGAQKVRRLLKSSTSEERVSQRAPPASCLTLLALRPLRDER